MARQDGKGWSLLGEALLGQRKYADAESHLVQSYLGMRAYQQDKGDKFTLKAEPGDQVDGRPAAVVLATRKGMNDVRLFFDADTGRLVKYTRKGIGLDAKAVDEEVLMSEFKEFSGVLLPTVQKVRQNGKDYITVKVTDVKLTDKPDLKAFAID